MQIGMQTWGSDGDIRPFAALSGGLSVAGHNVTLAITSVDNKDYTSLSDRLNFKTIRVFDTFEINREIINKINYCVMKVKNPLKQLTIIFDDFFEPAIEKIYAASQKLCQENDIVIGHNIVHPLCVAAEKSGRPYVTVALNHAGIPSRHITPAGLPYLGKWMNPFWWKLVGIMLNRHLKPYFNRLRKREGVPMVKNIIDGAWESKILNLIAVSASFCQHQADWGDHNQVCGFLNVPEYAEEWYIVDGLRQFIGAGAPPVYMTFGSLMPINPADLEETVSILVDAVTQAKCRAIIQSSLEDIHGVLKQPDIYHVTRAPYNQIFPYCSAVVHHGGAGTVQLATRSGCPSVVVEHIVDQTFWGRELKCLGITANLLHRRSLTAKKLAKEIRTVLNSSLMKEKAQTIGEAMKNEDGVRRAVELIEKRFEGGLM